MFVYLEPRMIDLDLPRTPEELTVWALEHAAILQHYFSVLVVATPAGGVYNVRGQVFEWLLSIAPLQGVLTFKYRPGMAPKVWIHCVSVVGVPVLMISDPNVLGCV
jgi:hypothetical protein